MKYPKIQSLWKREGWYYDEVTKKSTPKPMQKNRQRFIEGDYASPEFANVKHWLVTEKIDGMNIRIHAVRTLMCDSQTSMWDIKFSGRTDNAMLPPKLLEYLQDHFPEELFEEIFKEAHEVLLFGEGYGPKIQSGGYYYSEQRFVLFDARIDDTWWMEWDAVMEMSNNLDVPCAPPLLIGYDSPKWTEDQIVEYVKGKPNSLFADDDHVTEGVVARAYPMMLFRNGTPIKFKLKCKDFKDED